MASLVRCEAGGFSIEEAYTIDRLEEMTDSEKAECLIPTEKLFTSLPKILLPDFFEKLCRSGCEIYQKKIRTDLPVGTRVRICDSNGSAMCAHRPPYCPTAKDMRVKMQSAP